MPDKRKKIPIVWEVLVAAVVIVIVLILVFSGGNSSSKPNLPSVQPPQTGNGTQSSAGTLFSDSPYASYAYLISTSPLSSQAKEATTGFAITSVQNSNGSATYRLATARSNYVNQTYTLEPGQKLYFIERSLGDDDASSDTDYMLGDDTAIIVDTNGYIVQ
jgi:hypothetical protein